MPSAFCVKCKAKREMKNAVKTSVNSHPALKGECPKCGTKMFTFVAKK